MTAKSRWAPCWTEGIQDLWAGISQGSGRVLRGPVHSPLPAIGHSLGSWDGIGAERAQLCPAAFWASLALTWSPCDEKFSPLRVAGPDLASPFPILTDLGPDVCLLALGLPTSSPWQGRVLPPPACIWGRQRGQKAATCGRWISGLETRITESALDTFSAQDKEPAAQGRANKSPLPGKGAR